MNKLLIVVLCLITNSVWADDYQAGYHNGYDRGDIPSGSGSR